MGTIDSLLAEHVSFRCTSVDRIGTRGYIPGLQYEGGVVKFLLNRGFPIPSPAALNQAHEHLVADLDAMVASSGAPLVRFKRGSPLSPTTGIFNAPRGAFSYPRRSREELRGRFLGLMANLDPKGKGDNSMPGKRRSCPGVRGDAPAGPV